MAAVAAMAALAEWAAAEVWAVAEVWVVVAGWVAEAAWVVVVAEVVRAGIAPVLESRRIFPDLTVHENLLMGAYTRRDADGVRADLERVLTLFPVLGERRSQPGGALSGGEQQMLAMGRALLARPRLLVMDEPSMGLSPMYVDRIFDIIQGLNRDGIGILLVEQNANMALSIAARGYVLQTGKVVLSDSAENLKKNEDVQKAYLGVV